MIKSAVRRLLGNPAPGGAVLEFDPQIWLAKEYSISTLIDLGANDGQHGASLARHFGVQHAYFFEPQPQYAEQLRIVASGIERAQVFQMALGDSEGEAEFYAMAHAPSSSLLPPEKALLPAYPQHEVRQRARVAVRCLDSVLADQRLQGDVFIKMDVQGFEDRVIRGGRLTFGRARAVLVEMSFVPLFVGQSLFEEVHALLVECGLRFAGIKNQVMMPASFRPAFAHCVYIRS
jgi:FkbM family methyltransferase